MSKAKLTISNQELPKFKDAVDLAGLKILGEQNVGEVNQVVVYYKTEMQIFDCGRYMEKITKALVHPVKKSKPVPGKKGKTKK